jgi:hypothetical protein
MPLGITAEDNDSRLPGDTYLQVELLLPNATIDISLGSSIFL